MAATFGVRVAELVQAGDQRDQSTRRAHRDGLLASSPDQRRPQAA